MQRIGAKARRDHFPAYHQSGERPRDAIKYVVWHDTEGGTADSIAAYFQSRTSGGSAHVVIDNGEVQRCLDDTTIPWGAPAFNTDGLHIEQCGYARWGVKEWLRRQVMLHRTAYRTARWCKTYRIPVRFVHAEGLRAGRTGITTHREITASGLGGAAGTHTDPGLGYPRRFVMGLTRTYRAAML